MFPVNGPTFLVFYVVLFAAAGLAYWALRAYIISRAKARAGYFVNADDLIDSSSLTPPVVGYLIDGPKRAAAARTLASYEGKHLGDAHADALLASRGLILSTAERASIALWGAALFGGLLAAGLVRFIIGAAHHKPVGYLLALLILVIFSLYSATRHRLLRTEPGQTLASHLRSRYRPRSGDIAMGFAIFGWSALDENPAAQAHLMSFGYYARTNINGFACDGICVATTSFGGGGGWGSGCTTGCSSGCGGGGGGCGGCS